MSDFSQPVVAAPHHGSLTTYSTDAHFLNFQIALQAVGGATSTGWSSANRAIYQHVIVAETLTVTHLAVRVITAAGNIDVGIYTESGTRLVSSGSTAVAGADALQSFDVTDTTLPPGGYWLACACSSTSAVLFGSSNAIGAGNFPHARARGLMIEASALPLPASATFAAASGANFIPFIAAFFRTTF